LFTKVCRQEVCERGWHRIQNPIWIWISIIKMKE
jgi:hypothetical protein